MNDLTRHDRDLLARTEKLMHGEWVDVSELTVHDIAEITWGLNTDREYIDWRTTKDSVLIAFRPLSKGGK